MAETDAPGDTSVPWTLGAIALIVLTLYGSKGDRGSVLLTTFSPELSVAPGID